MSLRRRGQLLPLERRTNENEDDESDSQNVFAHYVSPCDFQVSNDPLGSNQGQCDTNLIGCVRDHDFLPGTREQTKEIKLEYEYDLYYQFDSKNYNFMDMLDFIEGAMLDHVASPAVLDKQQCGASGSGRRLGDDRRYLLFSDDIKKAIVAISSEPLDKQNRNYGM